MQQNKEIKYTPVNLKKKRLHGIVKKKRAFAAYF
jgi:hypothetical protein